MTTHNQPIFGSVSRMHTASSDPLYSAGVWSRSLLLDSLNKSELLASKSFWSYRRSEYGSPISHTASNAECRRWYSSAAKHCKKRILHVDWRSSYDKRSQIFELESQQPKPYKHECVTSGQKHTGSQALNEADRRVGVNNSAVQGSAYSRVRSRPVPPLKDTPGTPSPWRS